MERYTPGDSPQITHFMARRSLATHGAFFRPFLFAGARVLDCGCGPGTITVDIAKRVAPGGMVYGVDANAGQIEVAQQALRGVANAEFRVGSAYELPFESGSFDAVFSHALFEHLAEPGRAAREVLRVLKPGGVAGLRSPDWTGRLAWPESSARGLEYYAELQAANGGDLRIGRKLGGLLREAGFCAVRSSASYECYAPVELIGEYLAAQIEASDGGLAEGLRDWCRHPDAFFAQAWGEAVGAKAAEL